MVPVLPHPGPPREKYIGNSNRFTRGEGVVFNLGGRWAPPPFHPGPLSPWKPEPILKSRIFFLSFTLRPPREENNVNSRRSIRGDGIVFHLRGRTRDPSVPGTRNPCLKAGFFLGFTIRPPREENYVNSNRPIRSEVVVFNLGGRRAPPPFHP